VSTHTLEVAQELCDRIGIILRGELVALGTLDDLKAQAETNAQNLEEIFLKLTGGEGFKESEESL
jgi:ABC-2 type transport system ATP-binding protein